MGPVSGTENPDASSGHCVFCLSKGCSCESIVSNISQTEPAVSQKSSGYVPGDRRDAPDRRAGWSGGHGCALLCLHSWPLEKRLLTARSHSPGARSLSDAAPGSGSMPPPAVASLECSIVSCGPAAFMTGSALLSIWGWPPSCRSKRAVSATFA